MNGVFLLKIKQQIFIELYYKIYVASMGDSIALFRIKAPKTSNAEML